MAKYGTSIYGTSTYGAGGSDSSSVGHSFAVASPSASAPLLVHKFNVDRIDTVFGSIRPLKYRNQFDELGDIVSLRRLPEETNWEYRRRIQDAMVNYANSTYRGMIHGVTRELGLALYDSILINPKVDSGGRFLAPDPYIRFEGPYLYLYSDYANNMLDWAIDRYESGGNYEHVGRLVEMVNNTSFFEAGLPYNIDYYTRSMTLLNQSNRRIVSFERVPASTVFTLKHDRVIRGSLFFSNRTNFRTEVASEDLVLSAGQYSVDYHSGTVKVFTIGTISDIVRYQYVEYPFVALASPVIIHDVTNENFRTKMFNQVLQDDGTYTHGLPTELGVDIINELLSVIPMYFGV